MATILCPTSLINPTPANMPNHVADKETQTKISEKHNGYNGKIEQQIKETISKNGSEIYRVITNFRQNGEIESIRTEKIIKENGTTYTFYDEENFDVILHKTEGEIVRTSNETRQFETKYYKYDHIIDCEALHTGHITIETVNGEEIDRQIWLNGMRMRSVITERDLVEKMKMLWLNDRDKENDQIARNYGNSTTMHLKANM